ncbi:MAG: hypothetical protein ACFN4J_08025, partial [Segatella oulorum]
TQSYNVKGFGGIDIGMVGNVEYVQGDTGGHTGTAPTNLHQTPRRQPTFLACLSIGERFLLRALMPLEHGC